MLRDLAIAGLVGGLGWVAWRLTQGQPILPAFPGLEPPVGSMTQPGDGGGDPIGSYLARLAQVESGGDPLAHALTSSASGLYQLTKATAQALGLPWGSNPSLPFGGAVVTPDQQTAAIAQLTDANAAGLQAAGIAVTSATLYAAHFLGLGAAIRVLSSAPTARLVSLLPGAVLAANPFLASWSVADFEAWLQRKMG